MPGPVFLGDPTEENGGAKDNSEFGGASRDRKAQRFENRQVIDLA